MDCRWLPAMVQIAFKSSRRLVRPYDLVSVIWNSCDRAMNAARRVRDCLPLPPTPTSSAEPRDVPNSRVMRVR